MRKTDDYYGYGIEDELEHRFLTPVEVMQLLAIGRSGFYALVRSGELPAFRVGKQWRVSKKAFYQNKPLNTEKSTLMRAFFNEIRPPDGRNPPSAGEIAAR